jgi:hypothetical protein
MKFLKLSLFVLGAFLFTALVHHHAEVVVRSSLPAESSAVEKSAEAVQPTASVAAVIADVPAKEQLSELTTLGQRALNDLATRSQLRAGRDQDFHHTPPSLLESAVELGNYKEQLLKVLAQTSDTRERNQILSQGTAVYRQCLETDDALTSLRALCYTDWLGLNAMAGRSLDSRALNVPSEVLALASSLD